MNRFNDESLRFLVRKLEKLPQKISLSLLLFALVIAAVGLAYNWTLVSNGASETGASIQISLLHGIRIDMWAKIDKPVEPLGAKK